jgi:DNA modification methylase
MNSPLIVRQIVSHPVDQLKTDPHNARTHSASQIQQLASSTREFGFVNPILAAPDGTVIAGHARLRAALQLGMREVPVIVLEHLSETQRRALVIADNQLALNAAWNETTLRAELAALQAENFDLNLIGFHEEELTRLLAEQQAEALADPDAVPDLPPAPVSQPGDLWILGQHRLLCGDATNREAVEAVLGGKPAAMIFTDPPYGVAYEGKTSQKLTIANDQLGDRFYEFLRAACALMIEMSQGAIYICMSSSELHMLFAAFTDAGGHWSTFLIWAKHHFTLGRSDYQRQYEPILYGWPEGRKHYWRGDRDQGDVWSIVRPVANREHPTMKPVELVERAVHNSSRFGDIVLDPFAGSGTTLIACHRCQRQARLLEIDPRYVDVICRRWQLFSGQPAILDHDGRSFDEMRQVRKDTAAA